MKMLRIKYIIIFLTLLVFTLGLAAPVPGSSSVTSLICKDTCKCCKRVDDPPWDPGDESAKVDAQFNPDPWDLINSPDEDFVLARRRGDPPWDPGDESVPVMETNDAGPGQTGPTPDGHFILARRSSDPPWDPGDESEWLTGVRHA